MFISNLLNKNILVNRKNSVEKISRDDRIILAVKLTQIIWKGKLFWL
jgi:hypothetical protein